MITIDEYKIAEKKLEGLQEEYAKIKDTQAEESNKLYIKYSDLESKLTEKKRREQNALTKKYDKKTELINKQSVPHTTVITDFQRIMNMMDIYKGNYGTDFTVYKHDYPRDENGEVIRTKEGNYPDKQEIPYIPINTIKNDKYAMIQAFIVENNKPKNKFSLLIAGSTIFTKKLIELPYSYGYPCNQTCTNIMILLKDLPTEKELRDYYYKTKSKILKKEFFEQLPKLEKEYENVLKLTDNKEWELGYWYSQKEYYEKHYSHGTETTEYQEVLKQIKQIKLGE